MDEIQKKMRRGITIIHEAEGAYHHDRQTVLLTIVTRFELPSLEAAMKESDPNAFVSISDNVKILGRFTKKITNKGYEATREWLCLFFRCFLKNK